MDFWPLLLIGTPLGNQDDWSPRAQAMVRAADLVLCEDTRVTGQLLAAFGIVAKQLMSYHEHNEMSRIDQVLDRLRAGERVVVLSDAGMPAISDPGERLVAAAIEAGLKVSVIPGPTAGIAALAVSGLSTRRFYFEGFLDAKGSGRSARLAYLATFPDTFVLFEAPHRLRKTLSDLAARGLMGRRLALCRELTKKYEEVLYLTVEEALDYYAEKAPRGEYVLVVEGNTAFLARRPDQKVMVDAERETLAFTRIAACRESGMKAAAIRRIIEAEFGLSRNEAYRLVLAEHDADDVLK